MVPVASGFTPPVIDWVAVAPVLALLVTAIVGVLAEAFAPRAARRFLQVGLGLVGMVVAFGFVLRMWSELQTGNPIRHVLSSPLDPITGQSTDPGIMGMRLDPMALFLQGTLLLLGVLSLLVLAERGSGGALESIAAAPAAAPGSSDERAAVRAGFQATEVFPLTVFSVAGMMIFVAAADLLVMFIALEIFSLPLYIMCAMGRHRRLLSQEASLKYFLLGAFSSAIFLFGIAIIYGLSGSLNIYLITNALGQAGQQAAAMGTQIQWIQQWPLLIVGVVLVLIGLLFKVGAVPFHSWIPDVYMGAPTPVSGFMAAGVKVAAFGALVRIVFLPVVQLGDSMLPALVVVATLTMVIGSVIALRQTDVKRMLAYSSIAHAGFILVGIASLQLRAIPGVLFYLVAYGLSTVAAFAIVTLIREKNPDGSVGPEANNLNQWNGLAQRSPWVAGSFAFLLLAFAGIPLTSGFIAKYGVLAAAVSTQRPSLVVLAVIGVLASAIAAGFYLRVIVRMYFSPSKDDSTVVVSGPMTSVAIVVGVVATIVLGLFPAPLLDWAGSVVAGGQ